MRTMKNKEEYRPISWQEDVDKYFNGVSADENKPTFDPSRVKVTGFERPENEGMEVNTIYFYYGMQKDEYKGLRCAIKNTKGEVIRLGLAKILQLAAGSKGYEDLSANAINSVGQKTGLDLDKKNQLFELIKITAKNSSGKSQNDSNEARLDTLNDQYDFLRDEFKAALEIRHQANKILYPLLSGFKKDQWHKKCDEFYEAGLELWEATDRKNLPAHFHTYNAKPNDVRGNMSELIKDKFLGQKDMDGSKIELINQVLERARRDVEFVPSANPTSEQITAHVENLKQINLLSQQVLRHSDLDLRKIGLCLLAMSAFMIGMVFCPPIAIPVLGVMIATMSMSMLPSSVTFTLSAMSALMGIFSLALSRERTIATISSATSNYKQAVKDINKDMNEGLKNEYEEIDKNTPLVAKLFK